MLLRPKDFIYIFLLALLWSFSFIFVRVGVAQMAPFSFTFYRLLFASTFLIIVALITRARVFKYVYLWPKFIVSSLLLNVFPFALCSYGEVWVESSITGIIEGSTPLFTLLFSYLIFGNYRITRRQVLGFLLGFIGLLIIFLPCLHHYGNIEGYIGGFVALVGMAVSFALGFLFVEKYFKDVPPVEGVTIQMFLAPFLALPLAYLIEGSLHPLPGSIALMLAILGVTSSLGWLVYFTGVKRIAAANLALSTMLCPLLTIVWGRLFLEEDITWFKIAGTAVVLCSLILMSDFLDGPINKVKKFFNL